MGGSSCNDTNGCTVDTCVRPMMPPLPFSPPNSVQCQCKHDPLPCIAPVGTCTNTTCVGDGVCVTTYNHNACNDSIECTVDTCIGGTLPTGCSNVPNNTFCGDDDLCTMDSCNVTAGGCVNEPMDCEDGNNCNTTVCYIGRVCIRASGLSSIRFILQVGGVCPPRWLLIDRSRV